MGLKSGFLVKWCQYGSKHFQNFSFRVAFKTPAQKQMDVTWLDSHRDALLIQCNSRAFISFAIFTLLLSPLSHHEYLEDCRNGWGGAAWEWDKVQKKDCGSNNSLESARWIEHGYCLRFFEYWQAIRNWSDNWPSVLSLTHFKLRPHLLTPIKSGNIPWL